MGMTRKTIKQVLRKRVDAWLESIDYPVVRELAAKNTVVTGGCIASMLLGEDVNDVDVYLRSREAALALARYYVERFKPGSATGVSCKMYVADGHGRELKGTAPTSDDERGKRIKIVIKSAGIATEGDVEKPYQYFESRAEGEAGGYVGEVMSDLGEIEDRYEETEQASLGDDDEKPKHRPVFLSTNAVTLSGRVQVVLRFYGEPDAIHENYDFVHCTNYWTSWDSHLELRAAAMESLLARDLRYVGSRYPVCSLFRLRKFIRRGWKINAGQVLKMAMQVSNLDLTDVEVLEDQLTGVDAAYFCEVLEKVKAKDPEKISYAYLVEIVDRMF